MNMISKNTTLQIQGPSLPASALCWTKALVMTARQRWQLFCLFYRKP